MGAGQEDPEQTRNIIAEEPEVAEEMVAAFADFAAAQRRPPTNFLDPDAQLPPLPPQPEAELDPEHKRELRALGYLR